MVMNTMQENEAERKLIRGGGRDMAILNRMVKEERLYR